MIIVGPGREGQKFRLQIVYPRRTGKEIDGPGRHPGADRLGPGPLVFVGPEAPDRQTGPPGLLENRRALDPDVGRGSLVAGLA